MNQSDINLVDSFLEHHGIKRRSDIDLVDSFLEHYGIKGQKWGYRNGPPYPIGSGGKARASKQNVGYADFKYKSKTGKELKEMGKAVAIACINVILPGFQPIHNAVILDRIYDQTDYIKKQGNPQKIKELPKIPKDQRSIKKDLKVINPGNGKGRVNNCGYCTAAFEMRQRGYDVEARKKANGILEKKYGEWFEGVKFKTSNVQRQEGQSRKDWAKTNYEALSKKLEAYGEGARGFIGFNWDKAQSGHTLAWMVKDGSVSYYDAQNGKVNDWNIFSFSDQKYTYGRLDNLKLKENVTEAVITRGGIKEK